MVALHIGIKMIQYFGLLFSELKLKCYVHDTLAAAGGDNAELAGKMVEYILKSTIESNTKICFYHSSIDGQFSSVVKVNHPY